MSDPFGRWGRLMVRHRWAVLGIWVVALVGFGGLLAPRAARALQTGGFFAPGSDSTRAAEVIDREFDAANRNTLAVVFHSNTATADAPSFRDQVAEAERRLAAVPGVR